jgi:MoaA/NifB/PqqE/SkfB family radical SAM enzyme
MYKLDSYKVENSLNKFLKHDLSLWELLDRECISAVSILLTYQCPSACPHCVFECSPLRRETVDPEAARRLIEAASRQTPKPSLSFSGGEAFLQLELMRELTTLAASFGMPSEVISSSSWATNDRRTYTILDDLFKRGMRVYATSVDQQHVAFINPRKIRRAIDTALDIGYKVVINSITNEQTYGHEPDYVAQLINLPRKVLDRCEVHPFIAVPVGRARSEVNDFLYLKKHFQEGCPFSTEIVTLTPYGLIYPCCGMVVGEPIDRASLFIQDNVIDKSVDEIAAIIDDLKHDLFFKLLQAMGPYQLLKEIKDRNPELATRSKYTGSCDVCLEFTANPMIANAARKFLHECESALKSAELG